MRALAHERFGVRRELTERTGAWEVARVPEELRSMFSRRHEGIVAEAGEESTRQERERISLETKRAKHSADATTMRGTWRQRAEDAGVDVDAMVAAAAPGPPGPDDGASLGVPGSGPRIPPPADLAATVFHPDTGLTRSEKTFSRAQLLAAVGNALPYGLDSGTGRLDELADQVLAVHGYAVRVPDLGSTVMSSTARYTTQDILDAEDVVTTQALARVGDGSAVLTADQAAAAITVFEVAAGYELSLEQREAVTRALTAGHGIDSIVGVAGAGKSTLMEACRIGWDATGTTYAGACLSAVAAQGLHAASGIPSRTVAAWLEQISSGKGLTGVDVLVVDEATMVDDRSAAVLMTQAARTGTKIIAVGDHLQLQAIGPGGWFKETHRLVAGLTLTENRRQEDAAERHALEIWRTGDHEQALQLLAAGGKVHAAETADEARSQILTTWDELRTRWPDTYDLISGMAVLAARNADVDALNTGAQQIRRAAGELGNEHSYALPGGERLTLAVGDAVRVRSNDYRSRRGQGPDMLNGYRAVITAMDEDRRVEITWRTRATGTDGPAYESAWLTRDQVASGALSLGYAMTIAASQGLTTDTALLYGHGANAFATYPGLTRGKKANHLWLPLAAIEDEATQARLGAARSDKERLERAVAAFAQFLGQSRPDSMVSDLLREPPEAAVLPEQTREHAQAADGTGLQERRARAARSVSTFVRQRRLQDAEPRELQLTNEQLQRLEDMQEERERGGVPSWNRRMYGDRTGGELALLLSDSVDGVQREDQAAVDAAAAARDLSEQLAADQEQGKTRGQRYVADAGDVLNSAERHLDEARRQLTREATAQTAAREATEHLAHLAASADKGRIALRLAGTSLKERKRLTGEAQSRRASAWQAESDARAAARDARLAAWETVRDSPYAETLGATRRVPAGDVDALADQFAAMRRQLPAHGQHLDTRDQQRVARLNGDATKATKNAAMYRSIINDVRTEQGLRTRIADKHPALHRSEQQARAEHHEKRAEQRKEQRNQPIATALAHEQSRGRSH